MAAVMGQFFQITGVNMSFTLVHDFIMYVMAAITAIATFIIIERVIFFIAVLREGKEVDGHIKSHLNDKELRKELHHTFSSYKGPQASALLEIVDAREMPHEEMEYYVQSVYVSKQPVLNSRLWMLDTIITLSPLLGLLGTIMGIIDSFHTLSSADGSSDPAGVSRGIGTALYATGFGIFIALYAMTFFNFFTSKVEQINNQMKLISLTVLAYK
jgi:biopolymer transport protein ExbB